MKENKIERIAKNIIGFKTRLQINNGTLIDIDEIVIVLSDEPVANDTLKYASKSRLSAYGLQEVKECLKSGRYRFKDRFDGKNNPESLKINENECIEIICNLQESNFDKTIEGENGFADVYKKFGYIRRYDGNSIDLYIKFSLFSRKDGKYVLIISFHREGEF